MCCFKNQSLASVAFADRVREVTTEPGAKGDRTLQVMVSRLQSASGWLGCHQRAVRKQLSKVEVGGGWGETSLGWGLSVFLGHRKEVPLLSQ